MDARSIRTGVVRAAEALGLEDRLPAAERLAARASRLRGGRAARQNRREDALVRLVAASALRPDSSCVDIGANVGDILSVLVEVAPEGRHIAYEPVPWLADDLERRFPTVEVRRAAVADEEGEAEFVVNTRLESRSSLRPVGYGQGETERITVVLERLDDALPDGFAPDLIKIDVEGAEHLTLRGALATLREHRPVVLFEHQESTAIHYDSGPDGIYDLLAEQADMRIFDMYGAGPYSREAFRSAYVRGTRWNFLAVPRGR